MWSVRAPHRSRSAQRWTAARVTLVFNVKNGEIEGTNVSGFTVAAVGARGARLATGRAVR
jgi:hypothetical protein